MTSTSGGTAAHNISISRRSVKSMLRRKLTCSSEQTKLVWQQNRCHAIDGSSLRQQIYNDLCDAEGIDQLREGESITTSPTRRVDLRRAG